MKNLFNLILLTALVVLSGCGNKRELNTKVSRTTGWSYNDRRTTNFQATEGIGTATPAGMIAIEGGVFTVGERDEFITAPRNNPHRSITVSSFYMDKYEITNLDWREYVHWTQLVFSNSRNKTAQNIMKSVLPDTTVWEEELAYNEPYQEYYFRHPAYSFYPIVGVSWTQAMAYCQWRTDRVNELSLISAGAITRPDFRSIQPIEDEAEKSEWEQSNPGYTMETYQIVDPDDPNNMVNRYIPSYEWIRDKFVFNTEKYLYSGEYAPEYGRRPLTDEMGQSRKANRSDGLFVVGYRLPTEAEWEFAAFAPIAVEDGFTIEGKIYPWSGYHPRNLGKKESGKLMANFIRARGDMMGTSHDLNDGYVITAPVDAYAPNDFGLYNMAGNVNEWVLDVYRETTSMEAAEYNSFRGNIFAHIQRDADGKCVIDSLGRVAMEYSPEDDKRDFRDGDIASRIDTDYPLDTTWTDTLNARPDWKIDPTDILAPRVNNHVRVYKGGSWNDRIFWLNPSTRRFLDEDASSNTIGFRCAMSMIGKNQIEVNK